MTYLDNIERQFRCLSRRRKASLCRGPAMRCETFRCRCFGSRDRENNKWASVIGTTKSGQAEKSEGNLRWKCIIVFSSNCKQELQLLWFWRSFLIVIFVIFFVVAKTILQLPSIKTYHFYSCWQTHKMIFERNLINFFERIHFDMIKDKNPQLDQILHFIIFNF